MGKIESQPLHALLPGFADPVMDAGRVFRTVLDAMAHPGTIHDLPVTVEAPAPLGAATMAILLTLADHDTPVWLDPMADTEAVKAHLRFHCGTSISRMPLDAGFAVVTDSIHMPPLHEFASGTDQYPDRAATVIIQVESLTGAAPLTLTGPGIQTTGQLAASGLPDGFADRMRGNHALFPCGVDLILTCGSRFLALPRSTRLEG